MAVSLVFSCRRCAFMTSEKAEIETHAAESGHENWKAQAEQRKPGSRDTGCTAQMDSVAQPGHTHTCWGHDTNGDHYCAVCQRWWYQKPKEA